MSLLKNFSNKSAKELVTILESGGDYTAKAKEAAMTILELKKISQEELFVGAKEYWNEHLKEHIKSYLLSKDRPKSNFLNDKEMGDLFKIAFINWKENQKTFEVDTTKYWFI